ncbi:MAG: hypothetical protein WCB94_17665, partial [Terriglobales bacterium]
MNIFARTLWVFTLVCLPAVGQVTPAASGPAPSFAVAEVDGRTLTSIDLEQKKSGSLLQARYQYYMSQRKALDQLVDDELLSLAAERLHMTTDELLQKIVYKDIKDPTE